LPGLQEYLTWDWHFVQEFIHLKIVVLLSLMKRFVAIMTISSRLLICAVPYPLNPLVHYNICFVLDVPTNRSLASLCLTLSLSPLDSQPHFLVDEGVQADDDGSGNYTLYNIVLCESLVRLLYPENFDDCGLVVPSSRGEICLGDGTVRPSDYWGSGEEGALNFLNDETGGKPPLFADDDGVKFRVIVSSHPSSTSPLSD
jgi:hypothetical protein